LEIAIKDLEKELEIQTHSELFDYIFLESKKRIICRNISDKSFELIRMWQTFCDIEKRCFSDAWSRQSFIDEIDNENSVFIVVKNLKKL